MKTIYTIQIGKGIPKARKFEDWLMDRGHIAEAWEFDRTFIDGKDVIENMEAAEIWQKLWDEFKGE